jgi:hypothetical protein
MEDLSLFMVPISLFVSIAVAISLYFYFRHRTRAEVQQTVRAAFDHGQQLTPELLETLAADLVPSADADFRRGVMACAVGLGIAAFGLLTYTDIGMPLAFIGVGALPFIVGVAYLGLWKFGPRR